MLMENYHLHIDNQEQLLGLATYSQNVALKSKGLILPTFKEIDDMRNHYWSETLCEIKKLQNSSIAESNTIQQSSIIDSSPRKIGRNQKKDDEL